MLKSTATEFLESTQGRLEREFWEKAACGALAGVDLKNGIVDRSNGPCSDVAAVANELLNEWRERFLVYSE
jgi:hypothetical protein